MHRWLAGVGATYLKKNRVNVVEGVRSWSRETDQKKIRYGEAVHSEVFN